MTHAISSFAEVTSENPWQRAYVVTIGLTALSLTFALMMWGYGVDSQIMNAAAGGVICAVGFYCALRMILAGALFGALPYFLIGSGIFYGAGTVIAVANPSAMALLSFTEDAQRLLLAKANLANALGIFIVVLAAAPVCALMRPDARDQPGLRNVIASLEPYLAGMLLVATMVMALVFFTFPRPDDLVFAALLRVLTALPLFSILLGAALWDRISGVARLMVLLLVVAFVAYGVLTLTKVNTLLAVVVLMLGWWLNGRMARWGVVLLLFLAVFYFMFLAQFVAVGRGHVSYDPELNTLGQRAQIVVEAVGMIEELHESGLKPTVELRFVTTPFQAYFMSLYDTGFPGDTLKNAQMILIPRILWPEKPIFSPGNEFDTIFRGSQTENSLAIGLFSEGYWNLGWWGIVIVSVVVGVQLGWFTRKWFLFTRYGTWHAGIFVMSPVVVYTASWAEVNFVGGYVGGTVRMIMIIMLIDLIARAIISYRNTQLRV